MMRPPYNIKYAKIQLIEENNNKIRRLSRLLKRLKFCSGIQRTLSEKAKKIPPPLKKIHLSIQD